MQTIFPILRYEDARSAIAWLTKGPAFSLIFSVPESGPMVRHAQLRLGPNIIMLGSIREDDGISTPKRLGLATQSLSVYVPDVDKHFESTKATEIEILLPPSDNDFGARECHARDPEGHLWTFTTFLPPSVAS